MMRFQCTDPRHETPCDLRCPACQEECTQTKLRPQIQATATRIFGEAFVAAVSWPQTVDRLCVKAFIRKWPESRDTRAIRRAYELLEAGGVSDDESAVE